MFTGLITEIGIVRAATSDRKGRRLRIAAPVTAAGLALGGSVAVDGVCLTATEVDREGFSAQVVPETARRSTLGTVTRGRKVNLERPLSATAEIGGHFVQGHVDACAKVLRLRKAGKEVVLEVQLPAKLSALVVEKGSIAVNGVSLTVASVSRGGSPGFSVALIPHTLAATNLSDLRAGDAVNLEADILGKYVQTYLARRDP